MIVINFQKITKSPISEPFWDVFAKFEQKRTFLDKKKKGSVSFLILQLSTIALKVRKTFPRRPIPEKNAELTNGQTYR